VNTLNKKKVKRTKNMLRNEVVTLMIMNGLKSLFLIYENIKNWRSGFQKRIKKKAKKDQQIRKEIHILTKS